MGFGIRAGGFDSGCWVFGFGAFRSYVCGLAVWRLPSAAVTFQLAPVEGMVLAGSNG